MIALHYGTSSKPIAIVEPDAVHAGMHRISWPDGRASDMTNLTRARDAAMVKAITGPPRRNAKLLRWGPMAMVGYAIRRPLDSVGDAPVPAMA